MDGRRRDAFASGAWQDDEDEDYASNDADESEPSRQFATVPSLPRQRAAPFDAPEAPATRRRRAVGPATSGRTNSTPRAPYEDEERYQDDHADDGAFAPRSRVRSMARPLRAMGDSAARLPAVYDEAPIAPPPRRAAKAPLARQAAVYRRAPLPARVRVKTQALVHTAKETATSPLTGVRFAFAVAAIVLALGTSHAVMGEPPQPLMGGWQPGAGSRGLTAVVAQVAPETQGKRPDLYDSYQQFQDWWDAACSAATASEVLTAWGAPHATIGRLIDVMQPDISLNGGLINYHGFQRGAAAFGYRADDYMQMSIAQIRYVTNVLGLPVIVNVRISYGYYHYFDTGHFLVVTAGDSQGLRIVDSSEYYIHYLPLDVFDSMYTGRAVVIVPKDYTYSIAA